MVRAVAWSVLLIGPFFLAGCFFDEDAKISLVQDNPFGHSAPPAPSSTIAAKVAPTVAVAVRVDQAGQAILAANPQIGMKPNFVVIGAPQAEIFHRGISELIVTEGLVNQCATSAQLTAVLCQELGKMASEHEALVNPQARVPERIRPMEVRVGNDGGGAFGPADQVYRAELGMYEKEYKQKVTDAASAPAPDPLVLARAYLTKTGYAATELDAVAPILREAGENRSFAKQMLAPTAAPATP